MKPTSDSWSAEPEGSSLSIRGSATFPNDFSTASLRRQQYTLRDGDTLTSCSPFTETKSRSVVQTWSDLFIISSGTFQPRCHEFASSPRVGSSLSFPLESEGGDDVA